MVINEWTDRQTNAEDGEPINIMPSSGDESMTKINIKLNNNNNKICNYFNTVKQVKLF